MSSARPAGRAGAAAPGPRSPAPTRRWPGAVTLLGDLSDATRWAQEEGSEQARALMTAYLRDTNDRERGRLQSGMYG